MRTMTQRRDEDAAMFRSPSAPPIERYIRCSVTVGGWTVEPGLEWREGDAFEAIVGDIEVLAHGVASLVELGSDPMAAAARGEVAFSRRWPGRAFFIEVHDAKCERWTQTYQPYGVPRR